MTIAFINTNARHNAKDTALSQNNETTLQKEKKTKILIQSPSFIFLFISIIFLPPSNFTVTQAHATLDNAQKLKTDHTHNTGSTLPQ